MAERPDPRVLILAPSGSDAAVIRRLLTGDGVACAVCADAAGLVLQLQAGAGALVVASEALDGAARAELASTLARQPHWSDLPVLLLTLPQHDTDPNVDPLWRAANGHVTVLERPLRSSNLLTAVRVALLARRRQLQVRDELARRELVEQRLRASDTRYRETFDNAPVGIATLDLDGRWLRFNDAVCHITGYAREELEQLTFRDITHPDDREPGWPDVQRLLSGRSANTAHERRCLRADGHTRWMRLSISLALDAEGAPHHFIAVVEDVTVRKRAELALEEGARRKDEFLATLGHELRNPLSALHMGLEILRRTDDETARAQSHAVMEQQVGHLARLVDDLLDVSRIEHGKLVLQRTVIELGAVVRSAVDMVRATVEAAGHELRLTLTERPVYVDADPVRLAQAVGNLLSNAAKYTPEGGHILVRARVDGEHVQIDVVDDGVGIPRDRLGGLFELFHQLDRSLETGFRGLGIGLALTRSLVEMHGGEVGVHSEGPGKGSTFSIRLPLAETPALAGGGEPTPAPAASAAHRVLVVDDNQDAARMLGHLLEMFGHEVYLAHHGRDALRLTHELRPHLLFLDIGMPELNGYEVARRLRAELGDDGPLIAALTGWGQERDRQRALDAGCDRHLTKPPRVDELHAVLAAVPAHAPVAAGGDAGAAERPARRAAEAPRAADAPPVPERNGGPAREPSGADPGFRKRVHDLRGALNTLVLRLQVLQLKAGGEGELAELVEQAQASARELTERIDGLRGPGAARAEVEGGAGRGGAERGG